MESHAIIGVGHRFPVILIKTTITASQQWIGWPWVLIKWLIQHRIIIIILIWGINQRTCIILFDIGWPHNATVQQIWCRCGFNLIEFRASRVSLVWIIMRTHFPGTGDYLSPRKYFASWSQTNCRAMFISNIIDKSDCEWKVLMKIIGIQSISSEQSISIQFWVIINSPQNSDRFFDYISNPFWLAF